MHSRALMNLETAKDCGEFVKVLTNSGLSDNFVLENFDGTYRVDARSLLGVIYASAEFGGEVYLVNLTEDGKIPYNVDVFRA